MTGVVFDPFIYLSAAGAAAGVVPAVLLHRIKRSRRPMRARARRRTVAPIAAVVAVALVGVAFLLDAGAILEYRIEATALVLVPFLLVWALLRVPVSVRVFLLLACVSLLVFDVLRAVPIGGSYSGTVRAIGVEGEVGSRHDAVGIDDVVALLLIERRREALSVRLLPVAGAPLLNDAVDGEDEVRPGAPTDLRPISTGSSPSAEYLVSLSGEVALTAEVLVRDDLWWFFGPRSLLVSLVVEGDGAPRLERKRALAAVVVAVEEWLTPGVFQTRRFSTTIPEHREEFLQEGPLPISLNATTH